MMTRVGVWDQWCAMSDKPYVQDGKPALLDETNCRRIVANFAEQKDDLPCNKSHEKTSTVAYYNALALLIGGRVVAMASHDPGLPQPTALDFPGGDNGSPPDDGIYWHRARLTELGEALGPYIRKVSPEFVSSAKNQYGEEIGYQALGGAWTNYPFLDGNEKHEFERKSSMPKKPRFYEDAGIDDKDADDVKVTKMRSYGRGKFGDKFSKYEASAGVTDKDEPAAYARCMSAYMAARYEADEEKASNYDVDPNNAAQNAAVHLKTGAEHSEPGSVTKGKGADVKAKYQDPVVESGTPPEIGQKPASTDQVAGQGHSMTKSTDLIAFEKRMLEREREVDQKFADLAREKQQAKAAEQAHEYTKAAWREGRILPREKETEAQAQQRILTLYQKGGKEMADIALLDPHSYTPREAMLTEYSKGGIPFGWQDPTPDSAPARPDHAIIERACALAKADGKDIQFSKDTYRTFGKDNANFFDYARRVAAENPALHKAWVNQPKLAMSGRE